jgi:hypothetical protein
MVGSDVLLGFVPDYSTCFIVRDQFAGVYYVTAVYEGGESEGTSTVMGFSGDDNAVPDILILDFDDGANLADQGTRDEASKVGEIFSRWYLLSTVTAQNAALDTFNLLRYDMVWIVTCINDSCDETLPRATIEKLMNYIGGGGGVYWEGADAGWDYGRAGGFRRAFFNLFGASLANDGRRRDLGNVQTLTGEPSFFREGAPTLGYDYQGIADTRVDEFTASTDAQVIMNSQSSPAPESSTGRMVAYQHPDYNYRTVISSVYLGAMTDQSPSIHHRWMVAAWIYNYLTYKEISEIAENEMTTPSEIALIHSAPNPFNSSCEVYVSMPSSGNADLSVYDIEGKHISTLFNGSLNSAYHSCTFHGNNLATGLYFVRLVTKDVNSISKMYLLK